MANSSGDFIPPGQIESAERLSGSPVTFIPSRHEPPHDEVAISKFNIFTLRTNQRIYREIIAKRNMDRQYIEALEAILLLNRINLPERESITASEVPHQRHLEAIDGSSEALTGLLAKIRDLYEMYHVQICFKDLGYWTNSTKPYIPTVGSTMANLITGRGPKYRVDILKGLTGTSIKNMLLYLQHTYSVLTFQAPESTTQLN